MLRVLTLSTLFPDATRPNFGVFVARQVAALSRRDGVAVRVVAPLGLPLWPLSRHPRYRGWDAVPRREVRDGVTVDRPRFRIVPGTGGRFHVAALTRALVPLLDSLRADFPFDVIDASFFFPDGPAAVALSRRYGVPVSIKARGADIHHWGHAPATAAQVRAAGRAADGLLAVSAAMRDDMAAIGIPAERVRVHHTGVDLTRFAPAGDRDALRASLGIAGPSRRTRSATPAADVMALASSSEGLANAWVESLACGTPIVITDVGGARDVVRDDAAGRIVARDPAAVARAISDLLTHPPARDAVRAHALRFTWDANAAALHAHLAGLVHLHQAAGG